MHSSGEPGGRSQDIRRLGAIQIVAAPHGSFVHDDGLWQDWLDLWLVADDPDMRGVAPALREGNMLRKLPRPFFGREDVARHRPWVQADRSLVEVQS